MLTHLNSGCSRQDPSRLGTATQIQSNSNKVRVWLEKSWAPTNGNFVHSSVSFCIWASLLSFSVLDAETQNGLNKHLVECLSINLSSLIILSVRHRGTFLVSIWLQDLITLSGLFPAMIQRSEAGLVWLRFGAVWDYQRLAEDPPEAKQAQSL